MPLHLFIADGYMSSQLAVHLVNLTQRRGTTASASWTGGTGSSGGAGAQQQHSDITVAVPMAGRYTRSASQPNLPTQPGTSWVVHLEWVV